MGTRWRRAWTFGLAAGLCGGCSASGDLPASEEALSARSTVEPSGSRAAMETAEAVRLHLARGARTLDEMDAPGPRAPIDLLPTFARTIAAEGPWLLPQGDVAEPGKEARHADVRLPSRANGAFRVADLKSGLSVEVALAGAGEVLGEVADGIVTYPRGYGGVADVLHHPTAEGTEDYVFFRNALPAVPELRYEITLGDDVAGLRLVSDTLELLDLHGAPRLRMASPWAMDGDGHTVWLKVSVEGCKTSTDSRLPIGRPLVDPGARHCVVKLSWDNASVRAPLLVDPAWTTTTPMAKSRARHTASLLPDGNVLVVGGDFGFDNPLKSTEIYISKPPSGTPTWAYGPEMPHSRYGHTATTLKDGSILIAGGRATLAAGGLGSIAFAEIYNPNVGMFETVAPMDFPRTQHTATLLADGRVLVAGGRAGVPIPQAEVFDPNTNIWTDAGVLKHGRYAHTATLLNDGRVLVAGGGETSVPAKSAEIWNPETNLWTETEPMPRAHSSHTATKLSTGHVLVVGGNPLAPAVDVFEIDGTWKPGPNPNAARDQHTATLLSGNRILVAGGGGEGSPSTAEMFDPVTKAWIQVGSLAKPRISAATTPLAEGKVLVTGGLSGDASLKEAEIFTPPGFPCETSADCPNSFCIDGVCCDSACGGQCEACNGERLGLCSAIEGSPHGNREPCVGDEACAQCDGQNRVACSFPSGNSCGNGCEGSTLTVGSCDGNGACKTLFSNNCAPFKCNATELSCETKCAVDNDTCADSAQCNTEKGICVSLPTECVDGRMLELSDGITKVDCYPYGCRNGACVETCKSVDDCAIPVAGESAVLCDEKTSNCLKWNDYNETQAEAVAAGTCTTAAPGAPSPTRAAWLFALAAASLFAARRHRARP